jgi:hypothetical protein
MRQRGMLTIEWAESARARACGGSKRDLVDLQALHVSTVNVREHVALLEHIAALRSPPIAHSRNLETA